MTLTRLLRIWLTPLREYGLPVSLAAAAALLSPLEVMVLLALSWAAWAVLAEKKTPRP